MSKKAAQESHSKGSAQTNQLQQRRNLANIANNQIYTAKSVSKSSQKSRTDVFESPISMRDAQKQKKQILREFPEPDEYNVLKMSGILDAYQHFLKLLCKHGLPTGKVYQYAAQQILKYQKRKLNKELKMRAELDIQKIKKSKPEPSPEKPFHPSASPYIQH